jgi:hypothetical protein
MLNKKKIKQTITQKKSHSGNNDREIGDGGANIGQVGGPGVTQDSGNGGGGLSTAEVTAIATTGATITAIGAAGGLIFFARRRRRL